MGKLAWALPGHSDGDTEPPIHVLWRILTCRRVFEAVMGVRVCERRVLLLHVCMDTSV